MRVVVAELLAGLGIVFQFFTRAACDDNKQEGRLVLPPLTVRSPLCADRQQYGLAKSANEVLLVIEAYKALRDQAPYPANHVVGHLSGSFAFIVFDKSTSTLFVASDQFGKVPLFWGITADDAELLKGACGQLMCYENPKNKITAVPANEEEIWGATFKVEGQEVLAARE
ncbi:Nucleophile aminohydrolase, N-terminal [Sesbania bispinosa]|nr:Nucleophile aminohydrolase, N-terminal [Sesbania bispinosa]